MLHGPAELLPVSSSGHVTLVPWLAGWDWEAIDPEVRKSFEVALHTGAEVRTVTDWFGQGIDLDFVLHDPADIVANVERAGLLDVEWYHRGPFTARGETTQRLYVLARKA